MAINNFKPFALDPNANVTSQADWEALPALLSGFTAGKASSAQVNKAIRQASFIAAALAQYTANKSGLDVLDDGDLNGFISKMGTAFGKDFQALDATLSALAGLATGANKLPYFTGNDTAAQTDLTSVGRDIIGKNTIADILTYLGLPELFADEKRFHTSPESVEMITPNGEIIIELTNNGYVNVINKSTGPLAEIPPTGLEQQAGSHQKRMMSQKGVTDLVKSVETPVGMFATFPHRATQLPPKWYSTNGDRFSVSSPQGLALKSLPAELKSDWGITESGGMINVPNIKQSDGRAPFLRPVNGTNRQVGSVDGDKMRRIYGEYANSSWRDPGNGWGSASGVFDVRYDSGISGSTGANKGTVLVFDTNKVVDTGPEFKPLDIGVTLAVYLGV